MTVARLVWRLLSCSAAPPTQAAFHVGAGLRERFVSLVGASSEKPGTQESALTKLASGVVMGHLALRALHSHRVGQGRRGEMTFESLLGKWTLSQPMSRAFCHGHQLS